MSSNESILASNPENGLFAGSSPAMRTTFTGEFEGFGSSDTILTQNPPQSGEDEVSK
jgi:hypothetical protein